MTKQFKDKEIYSKASKKYMKFQFKSMSRNKPEIEFKSLIKYDKSDDVMRSKRVKMKYFNDLLEILMGFEFISYAI